jgi:hypothetical protein
MNIHYHIFHSGREVYDAQCLRPLERRDCGFECRPEHGYMSVHFPVCVTHVGVAMGRSPIQESYQMSK